MLLLDNFEYESQEIVSDESVLQGAEFVKYNAEGPDVAFGGVRLALAGLWAHVIRRANNRHRRRIRILEHARYSEIAELDGEVAGEEYILRFQISMDDPPRMDVFEGQADLNEPIKYLRFAKILLIFYFALDVVAEVAHFAVLHNDYQLLQREIALLVCHDVLVVQVLQKIYFEHGGFLLLLLEAREHHLLCYILLILMLVSYQISSAYCENRLILSTLSHYLPKLPLPMHCTSS